MPLEEILRSGQLAVTTEVILPKGTDVSKLMADIRHVRGLVHAVDVADNPRAVARMSNRPRLHMAVVCQPVPLKRHRLAILKVHTDLNRCRSEY